MTDKKLKKANDIKTELSKLRILKDSLNKRVVTIDFAFFDNLRNPFIDVIEGKIAELEAEFKKM